MRISLKYPLIISVLVVLVACSDIAQVEDISEMKVTLIAPGNEVVVKGNAVNFTWDPLEDAEEYHIQLASPSFAAASQVVIDSILPGTSFLKELLPAAYEWRVKAKNNAYETAYIANSFTLVESDSFSGNTVLLTSPEENFNGNETAVDLTWATISGAVEYRVQILGASSAIILDETVTANTIPVTFEEGNYSWQVRAQSATESTLYSRRAIVIDLTLPNVPTLTTPLDNSTQSGTDVDFSWTRSDVSGSEEQDTVFVYTDEGLSNLAFSGLGAAKKLTATLTGGTTYYWVVRSTDLAGNESISNKFKFTIN